MTDQLVDTAHRMTPELAETVADDNRLRRLSERTWKILMDNGLLRSLQPARWGGGEVSLLEFADAIMALARVSVGGVGCRRNRCASVAARAL
jgi:3-hydroxy-9,10-secoandrosta-1,3,5(10)-triene-9,17-dione monooxygenase